MKRIFLTAPFIRHYEGSVFELPEAIGISGWDEDERVREKQSCIDKRHYSLPDDGKGKPAELPVSDTKLCPENIFEKTDLKSGPCRITSVTEGLRVHKNDPMYALPLPLGMGHLRLGDSCGYARNIITVEIPAGQICPDKIVLHNRIDEQIAGVYYDFRKHVSIDLSDLPSGFYSGAMYHSMKLLHSFTVMKCFPLVVIYDQATQKIKLEKSLW